MTNNLPALTALQRSNFRHIYGDVIWYGVLHGTAIAFLNVYAARLGATTFQIAFITSAPAAVNLLLSLPIARWLEQRPLHGPVSRSALYHRLPYFLMATLPLWLANSSQPLTLAVITLVMAIPGTAFVIGFNAQYAQVVPPQWRLIISGRRVALVAASITVSALLAGQLLDHIPFPLNYQIVFLLGGLGSLVTTYHVASLRVPQPDELQPAPSAGGGLLEGGTAVGMLRALNPMRSSTGLRFLLRGNGRPLLRWDLLRSSYGRLMFAYLIFYIAQLMPVALFPILFVNDLRFTDGTISIATTLFHGAMVLSSLQIGRLASRFGFRAIMLAAALIYGAHPLLGALAIGAKTIWLGALIGGIGWGLGGSALHTHLMDRAVEADRPAYMALHNLVLNLGILVGVLLGPLLAQVASVRMGLAASGLLMFAAGALLWQFSTTTQSNDAAHQTALVE